MLSVFCGSDLITVRNEAFALVAKAEADGVRSNKIEAGEYEPGQLRDALGAASLFGGSELYVIDTPSENEALLSEVKAVLSEMSASSNQFVIIEGPLLAAAKKPYQKHATRFEEYTALKTERFNTFALTDALLQKDKKSLWVLFVEAKRRGVSDEEIIGILWWQLKMLWLAKLTTTASEAGVKDYPYRKTKSALAKFPNHDIERLSHSLLSVYHEGHAGQVDTALSLERWLLTI